jgi:hypothetical protein
MYLNKPLTPPIVNYYEINYHNKQDKGLVTSDFLFGTFSDKLIPYFCYPDVGFMMTRQELIDLNESNPFPTLLSALDQFSLSANGPRKYLVVPIVLGSDISPFSTYFLMYDGIRYDLVLTYDEQRSLAMYNVPPADLHTANSSIGQQNHNPGILYLAHPFIENADDASVVAYDTKKPVELWVSVGGKDENVQEEKIGTALRYVETKHGTVSNYVKFSIVDGNGNILGFKTIDEFVQNTMPAFLRVTFTKALQKTTNLSVSAIPHSLIENEISQDFIDKFSPTVSQDTQFFITPATAGDFGGSGDYSLPVGTREFTVPITLDSNNFAQACLYTMSLDDSDLVVVNNDLLVLARSFSYNSDSYDNYGYVASYVLKSMDGVVEYSSGTLFGVLDLRSQATGPYLLEIELVNMDLVEYILRAQNNQALSQAKRDTFFVNLNWCSHDQITGNLHSTLYGEKVTTLTYRVEVGGSLDFEIVSLIPFLNGNSEPSNSVGILL